MTLVRPRLTDYHGIPLIQEDAEFAIPFLDEDIPLNVDPFLLWKSPATQERGLYAILSNGFNRIGQLYSSGGAADAREMLRTASECDEVGLGYSGAKRGRRLSVAKADEILSLFEQIPEVKAAGFRHFEEIQLLVEGISRDRISDITCSLLKSFLIDFTMNQCAAHEIPTQDVAVENVYDAQAYRFVDSETAALPVNPNTNQPVLLVPKWWLRRAPWLNVDDYVKTFYVDKVVRDPGAEHPGRAAVLTYNRHHYGMVRAYVEQKERDSSDCRNDPLFSPIPVFSAKRKWSMIKALPTGKAQSADRKYELGMCQLLASLLYPHLDFAKDQVRTDSGSQIRDLIFYNGRSQPFLRDIYEDYGSKQLVFELKNVKAIDGEHVAQLNRYLASHLGRFGILVTRNRLSRAMLQSTIDLWSGQRKCIIAITDEDIDLMVNVYESRQRLPIEVLASKFIEFQRACPS
jgi:hypothetical protein